MLLTVQTVLFSDIRAILMNFMHYFANHNSGSITPATYHYMFSRVGATLYEWLSSVQYTHLVYLYQNEAIKSVFLLTGHSYLGNSVR